MQGIIMANVIKYKSLIKEISSDIKKIEGERLKDAAVYLQGKIRAKIKKGGKAASGNLPKSNTGNLRKGIKYDVQGETALVGFGKPAYHGHLLELGTVERQTKKGVSTGRIIKKPFLIPTFIEEELAVKNILMDWKL